MDIRLSILRIGCSRLLTARAHVLGVARAHCQSHDEVARRSVGYPGKGCGVGISRNDDCPKDLVLGFPPETWLEGLGLVDRYSRGLPADADVRKVGVSRGPRPEVGLGRVAITAVGFLPRRCRSQSGREGGERGGDDNDVHLVFVDLRLSLSLVLFPFFSAPLAFSLSFIQGD